NRRRCRRRSIRLARRCRRQPRRHGLALVEPAKRRSRRSRRQDRPSAATNRPNSRGAGGRDVVLPRPRHHGSAGGRPAARPRRARARAIPKVHHVPPRRPDRRLPRRRPADHRDGAASRFRPR
ncbi:MAG: hypothetical protein M1823_007009, partial [Watsoniomyces obsoletus]